MADTTIELKAPLPDGAARATLTWVGKGAKATPTTRSQAAAAALTTYSRAGISSTLRLTVAEAEAYLADADTLRRGGTPPTRTSQPETAHSKRTPAPVPTAPTHRPAPRTPTGGATRSTPTATTRTAPTRRASTDRSMCVRCGSRLGPLETLHLVHVENLDAFYRKAFDASMLATSTVYRAECQVCHAVEFFGTPS